MIATAGMTAYKGTQMGGCYIVTTNACDMASSAEADWVIEVRELGDMCRPTPPESNYQPFTPPPPKYPPYRMRKAQAQYKVTGRARRPMRTAAGQCNRFDVAPL